MSSTGLYQYADGEMRRLVKVDESREEHNNSNYGHQEWIVLEGIMPDGEVVCTFKPMIGAMTANKQMKVRLKSVSAKMDKASISLVNENITDLRKAPDLFRGAFSYNEHKESKTRC